MKTKREDVRNIAIIAHVDHGKTTLVDDLLRQSGVFRENQAVQERVMDSNDIERERGITILSKNTAVFYKGAKINIVDTPGHADFGGEVERVLKMVDGVVLVVDAFEGAMPQTKFVLMKALELDLPVIVCINKIDRPEARPEEVIDEVLELFMDLDASDEQLDCPFVYASAKYGYATMDLSEEAKDMTPLFETILNYIPAPEGDPEANTQLLVSTIDYNEYVGRIAIGKVDNGSIHINQDAVIVNAHEPDKLRKVRISKLYEFDGLNKVEVKEAQIGSIVAISGIADIHIGDTICAPEHPVAIPFQKISEPTIAMNFLVNDSPLAGQEGKYVTSRHIRDRLFRELNTDVSLRVEETDSADCFKVSGRGELHLSVLIENMRREGYEFAVSKAEVLYHTDENGKKTEPMELVYVDVPDEFSGVVIEKLSQRKGELQNMGGISGGYTRLTFRIPSRGLIGYRGDFLTDTKGNGIMNTIFDGYEPYKGEITYRKLGSLIAFEPGESVTYGLFSAQERGSLFIGPGEKVYSGMIVGECSRQED
ncbi:MAG: translational GTPase TypA, partial [Lachnospiraceae bacterium]|nr:translational GTPase TypA [Lachnospiraceae bacterium]